MIVRRGVLTDHYVEDDRSVVMVDESVLGLSPIATAILGAVPEGADVSLAAVTQHVVATFGLPEGPESAEALTEQQLWDLVAHKVLMIVEDDRSRNESRPRVMRPKGGADDPSGSAVASVRAALRSLRSDAPETWAAPDNMNPGAFVAAAKQHHVVSYFAGHLDRLGLPAQARSEIMVLASGEHAGAEVLVDDLSVALRALRRAGVRALAVKGVALAAQLHDDFSLRGAGDLDLLVAPEDVAVAHRALTQAGWLPAAGFPVPGPSWAWRHLVRTGYELSLAGPRSVIDLHWYLVGTRQTFPSFETLWRHRDTVRVATEDVPTLSRYDALAHSAGHAAKDRWRWMRSMVDVHTLVGDPRTWSSADRPLRRDQLLTVGLAVRDFGVPLAAPSIVDRAALQVDDKLLERVHDEQLETAPQHQPLAIPGREFARRQMGIRSTGGSFRESLRLLSRSSMPPWITADVEASSAAAAIPEALAKRTYELARKLVLSR